LYEWNELWIPLGVLAAIAAFDRRFDQAAQLYIFGLLTDVADGITARLLHGTSEFGKKFDRQTDMAFNAAVGLGLVSGGLYSGNGRGEAIAILALTVGVMTVSRLLGVAPGSGLAKLRSGWIRAVLLAFIVPRMTWEPKLAWIVPATLAALTLVGVSLYEIDLVRRDVASGRTGWFRRR
jgi:phosphatidylglycerophosphate synthase